MPTPIKELKPNPQINPALMTMFSTGVAAVKGAQVGGIPWYVYVIAIIVLVVSFIFLYRMYWRIETVGNIRHSLRTSVTAYSIYGDQRAGRKGLQQYLNDLKAQGVPESHFALTNFFVCSANSPAIFTPLTDGVVSPDAIRLNLAAGARYLDIPIHRGGKAENFYPYVTLTQPGSNWRRITMNQLPLSTIMSAIVENGLSGHRTSAASIEAAYTNDPLFIMLRFSGKPKPQTFTAVAKILSDTIEQHRLDFTFYNGRGVDNLFKTPITQFMGKVIILSNVYGPRGNAFGDYINIGPRGTTPLEMTPGEVVGIPDQNAGNIKARIQQNLTVARSPFEEPNCNTNVWDWTKAHALGIHFAALNFWSLDENLEKYRKPDVFGVNSFLLKPANMRYIIEYVAPPAEPSKELDARDGKPKPPQGLIAPG
jgi:hypothetical protein